MPGIVRHGHGGEGAVCGDFGGLSVHAGGVEHRGDAGGHVREVGEEGVTVCVAQVRGFDLLVEAFERQHARRVVQPGEDLQDFQRHQTLSIGRNFPQLVALVVRADGVNPRALGVGKVAGAVQPAQGRQLGQHVVEHPAIIEPSAALLADFCQCFGERREGHARAQFRQRTTVKQHGGGVAVLADQTDLPPPITANAVIDGEAFGGIALGGRDHAINAPTAKAFQQG